jgi:hypothetical protein
VHSNLRRAHDAFWQRFFDARTNLVYDIEFTDAAQFPTREEIAARIPSTGGWRTGMEDCCLDGGWMLDGLIEAHRVTGHQEWAAKARQLFEGLVMLGEVSSTPGFVARGVVPGRSDIYPNSSADQYTSFVWAMWAFFHSPLADECDKLRATKLVCEVAQLVHDFGGDIPTDAGEPSIYGDTSAFLPDRGCRLLMFYKAAHNLSGEAKWNRLYREKVEEQGRARLRRHFGPAAMGPMHSLHNVFQSQAAFRLLFECEDDMELKTAYRQTLKNQALAVIDQIDLWREKLERAPLLIAPGRWRDLWPVFRARYPDCDTSTDVGRKVFHRVYAELKDDYENYPPGPRTGAPVAYQPSLRAEIEAIAILLMCEDKYLQREAAKRAAPMLREVDWNRVGDARDIVCLEGAYWRGVAAGWSQ